MGVLYFVPARRFPEGKVPDVVKPRRLAGESQTGMSAPLSLEDLGLGHLDGAGLGFTRANNGPGGTGGLVIGFRTGKTGYFPATQTWRACEDGAIFIGWYTEAGMPGPEELIRPDAPEALSTVKLADGRHWGFSPTSALPEVACYDDAGRRVWRARAEHSAHYEASAWLMDFLTEPNGVRPYDEIMERVAVCLGSRYYLGVLELRALGLFATDLLDAVVFACLGVSPEKKTEAASD